VYRPRAADRIAHLAAEAVAARGRFTLALAGGSTPEKTYAVLAADPGRLDWSKALLFLGDERMVPPDDPRSNFGLAKRTLLDRVPAATAFPVPTDRPDAAAAYAAVLSAAFGVPVDGPPPRFDLILLGLGDDGHTASLFPGKPALDATAWTAASPPGDLPPPVDRVTLTFPVLNAAREVLFLVTGGKKADVVREVLEGSPPVREKPAAGVRPTDGVVSWFLDAAAAGRLSVS
jgi:6-phosphogluconolactonase